MVNNVSRKWNSNGKDNHCSRSCCSLRISLLANLVTRTTHQAASSIGRQSSIHTYIYSESFPFPLKVHDMLGDLLLQQSSDLIQMCCCWKGCLKRPSTSSSFVFILLTYICSNACNIELSFIFCEYLVRSKPLYLAFRDEVTRSLADQGNYRSKGWASSLYQCHWGRDTDSNGGHFSWATIREREEEENERN